MSSASPSAPTAPSSTASSVTQPGGGQQPVQLGRVVERAAQRTEDGGQRLSELGEH